MERIAHCPQCGAKMIEDAWDVVEILPNGDMKIEVIFPAWVCSSFCGYYEAM